MSVAAVASDPEVLCPFPGLRSFTEEQSHLFFGRDGESDALIRKLALCRFVAVVGTSGSGKSSLVRAGLLPSLHAGYFAKAGTSWRIADFRPGSEPLMAFASALAEGAGVGTPEENAAHMKASSLAVADIVREAMASSTWPTEGNRKANLLLLVDQFEELFRYPVRPESEMAAHDGKKHFVRLLIESLRDATLPIYLVITMRSEYSGDCAQFRDLPELINTSHYLIPRMTRTQLRESITGPVCATNARIEERLVQRLLNDVGDDLDQLPLMQHALQRTWYRWLDSGALDEPIDNQHYHGAGGIADALSNDANSAYEEACEAVPVHGDRIVRLVFQRLRDRDKRGRETRRPTSFGELRFVCGIKTPIPHDELLAALDPFLGPPRHFLTASAPHDEIEDDTEIDVTHECLLRKWNKLRGDSTPGSKARSGWIADEEESRSIYLRLLDRTQGSDPRNLDLLRGTKLQLYSTWWHEREPNVAWAMRYHEDASSAEDGFNAVEKLLTESVNRQKRDLHVANEARIQHSIELNQKRLKAEMKAQNEHRHRIIYILAALGAAVGLALGYMGTLQSKWDIEQGYKRLDSALALAITRQISGSSQLVLQEGPSRLHTGVLLAAESVQRGQANGETTPLESRLALISSLTLLPRPAKILDLPPPETVTTSVGGRWVATAASSGTISIWSSSVGSPVRQWRAHESGDIVSVTASADGRFLASLGESGHLRIWDVASGARLADLSCIRGSSWQRPRGTERMVFSADARSLLAACDGVRRWDRPDWRRGGTGLRLPWPALDTIDPIAILAFNADGTRLAVGGKDAAGTEEQVLILDASSGREIHRKRLTTADLTGVRFLGEGDNRLAASDEAGNMRVWDVTSETTSEPLASPPIGPARMVLAPPILSLSSTINSIAFSRDGGRLVVALADGTAQVFETRYWREIARLVEDRSINIALFVDEDRQILTVPSAGPPRLWSLPALGQITALPNPLASAQDAVAALGSDLFVRGTNRLPDLLRRDGTVIGQLRARWMKYRLLIEEVQPSTDFTRENAARTTVARTAVASEPASGGAATIAAMGVPFTFGAASDDGALLFVRLGQDRTSGNVVGLKRVGTGYQESWRARIDGGASFRTSPDGTVLAARVLRENLPAVPESPPSPSEATLVVFNGLTGDTIQRKILESQTRAGGVLPVPLLVAVSPGGQEVIYQTREGEIRVWRLHSNDEHVIVLGASGAVSASAFSANGRMLAIATGPARAGAPDSSEATIEIVTWPDGLSRLRWPLAAAVSRMVFSRSDRYVAAGGREQTVRIWDVDDARDGIPNAHEYEVARVGSTRTVSFFAFSENDKRIITLDGRHLVSHVWQDGDLLREACARVTRNLNIDEWKKYLPNVDYHKTCPLPR